MAYTMRRGMGDYDQVKNWSWLYYPPPYGFVNPDRPRPKSPAQFYAPAATMGLGCGCGGTCGGCSAPGAPGLGMFESGLDISGWGLGEWLTVGAGIAIAAAAFGKGKRTVRSRKAMRRIRGF